MMTDPEERLPKIQTCYGTLPSMLRKFDRFARRDYFRGHSAEEFEEWRKRERILLSELLGLEKMEVCDLNPVIMETKIFPEGIRREHIRIQTEPDVWMTMYLLVPADAGPNTRLFLCPPGHNGAGKYTVAGLAKYGAVQEKITQYQYDYGLQLSRRGFAAVCPDCRGFGERREAKEDTQDPVLGLKGDCYWLAHMGEPLGIPVAGMLVWDLMRLIDYLELRGEWDMEHLGCLGFSGGGMQTLYLAALDERVQYAVISGYMYGFRDALLTLNRNCSCNYIPHLWEHLDMGDIASLIAPRPLVIQSCRQDRLNGPRGIVNAVEQVAVIEKAYRLCHAEKLPLHDICEGGHQWHGERLDKYLEYIGK